MKRSKKLLIIMLVLLFAVTMVAGCGGTAEKKAADKKQVIELKIGGGHPTSGVPYAKAAHEFFQGEISKRVAEKTNYEIKWIEAYGGTIAKLAESLEATETGLLDFNVASYAFEPSKLFIMNMPYYVPFNTPDPIQATKATRKVIDNNQEVYDNLWKQYNQKLIAVAPTGDYELITTFPVNKVSDLKGHKIAAAGPNLPLLKGTGAVPVQSNLNEAYTSMQTGVYEGWVMFPSPCYSYKLHELAKYYTKVGFGVATIQGISVNLDTWNKIPKEVQDIILEVGTEYEIKAAEITAQEDAEALQKMKEAGVTITELSETEKVKWAKGLPDIVNEKSAEAEKLGFPGKKIWGEYIKALEDDGYKFPQKWLIK